MNDAIKTQISAFVDNELPDNESELLLRRLCQDPELRHLAAEYFALGRAIRGQRSVQGVEALRTRISAALDDNSLLDEFDAIEPQRRRYLRPVAGVAIAASVALVAIFGLQQVTLTPEVAPAGGTNTAVDATQNPGYTVPDVHRDMHNMESGNLDALLATFELREVDIEEPEADADADDADADNAVSQPQ